MRDTERIEDGEECITLKMMKLREARKMTHEERRVGNKDDGRKMEEEDKSNSKEKARFRKNRNGNIEKRRGEEVLFNPVRGLVAEWRRQRNREKKEGKVSLYFGISLESF
ncbi:hypothetical protein NDU88_006016 [Pleurodeles waltl]|uniref:Uncharacterized protein n=1 Tax=Pleurodeles waltl TaxID=8319 RepID=A0AAV7PHM6_PLEWA|nr:hypothetical protein NDU88_006016 [Pleurodeles waltl]